MIMTSTISTTDQSTGGTSADSNERLLQQIENLDIQSSQKNNSHGGGGTTSSVATADLLDILEQDMSSKKNNQRSKNEYSSGDDNITNKSNNRRPLTRRYSGYNSGDSSIEGSFTSKLLGGYTDLLDDTDNNNDIAGEEKVDTHITEEEEFIPSILDDHSAIKKSTNNNNYAASTTNSSGKSSSDIEIYATTPTKTKDGSSLNNYQKSNKSPYNSSDNSSKAHHMAPLGKHIMWLYLTVTVLVLFRVLQLQLLFYFNLLGRNKTLQLLEV